MSKGYSGLFRKTKGNPTSGSMDLMNSNDQFLKNIQHSKDLDLPGRIDIIAHGTTKSIEINLNGRKFEVDHRALSKLIKKTPSMKTIRLMSCDTGGDKNGFAQNLANKLNIIVEAPNKLLWAYPDGKYIVASRDPRFPNKPNLNDQGKFVKFYPGGNKRWKKTNVKSVVR